MGGIGIDIQTQGWDMLRRRRFLSLLLGQERESYCRSDYTRHQRKRSEAEIAGLASFPMLNPDPIVEVDFSGVIHSATRPQFSDDDLPLETRTGQSIAVEFVSNVYLVDHSRVIQCNILDITERKRAEEGQREALAKAEDGDPCFSMR